MAMYAEPVMPKLPMGFMEHAQSQHSQTDDKQSVDLDWWCDKLQGASVKPLLATDYARSGRANVGQHPGDVVTVRWIAPDSLEQIVLEGLAGSSGTDVTV